MFTHYTHLKYVLHKMLNEKPSDRAFLREWPQVSKKANDTLTLPLHFPKFSAQHIFFKASNKNTNNKNAICDTTFGFSKPKPWSHAATECIWMCCECPKSSYAPISVRCAQDDSQWSHMHHYSVFGGAKVFKISDESSPTRNDLKNWKSDPQANEYQEGEYDGAAIGMWALQTRWFLWCVSGH